MLYDSIYVVFYEYFKKRDKKADRIKAASNVAYLQAFQIMGALGIFSLYGQGERLYEIKPFIVLFLAALGFLDMLYIFSGKRSAKLLKNYHVLNEAEKKKKEKMTLITVVLTLVFFATVVGLRLYQGKMERENASTQVLHK